MRLQTFLNSQGPLIRRSSLTSADQRTLQSAAVAGLVIRLLPGVYVAGGFVDDLAVRAAAVALWNPDAVVTGRTAARFSFWPALAVAQIDVARDGYAPRAPGFRFESRVIDPSFIIERGNLRLTSPALTAIDLVDEMGGDAIDTCLRARAARLEDLWAAYAAHPFRPGNKARRRMLMDSRDNPWSAAERLAHRLLRTARITGWVANYRLFVSGACYYIDIAFRGIRLAVEIDGRLHEDDPGIFEMDRYRSNHLVSAGWTVLRFTYAMLVSRPEYVIDTIKAEIARLERASRK